MQSTTDRVRGSSPDSIYTRFCEPWPAFFSWNRSSHALHLGFAEALERTSVRAVDLADDFAVVAPTYRCTDGHWNTRGTELASLRETERRIELGPR